MKNLILIAPPGAGKGTQAKMLCKEFNMIHISIGDLLRLEIEKQNDLSNFLKDKMKTGSLVEDTIIFKIIEERLNELDIKEKGFILDGFPRNLNQAIKLDDLSDNEYIVIYLDVSKEVLEKRILGRLTCSNCGNVFNENIESLKPKKTNICDNCNFRLEKRLDDTKETFEDRYNTYIKETQPVLEFYKSKGNLYNVNSLDKDKIFNDIVNILRGNV